MITNSSSIGAWINPWTGVGYSGPKRNPSDIPADQTTGGKLPTTPTVNQSNLNNPTPIPTPPVPIIPNPVNNPVNNAPTNNQTNTQPPNIDTTQFDTGDPLRKFNLALMDMLKKAQSGETQMSQNKAQLQREAYQSGQQVFTGQDALMSPDAKMATLNRNVASFEPSIEAATTKINQLRDITELMKTTYGEDFSAMLPVTEEDAQVFKQALRAGMTIPADILTKYGKYFTNGDWTAWQQANAPKSTYQPPTSVQEYQYYAQQEKAAGRTPQSYAEFTGGGGGGTGNETVDSWVKLINEGKANITNVPKEYKNSVAQGLSQNPATKEATELQKDALSAAKDLLAKWDNGEGHNAVGGNITNRLGVVGDWLAQGKPKADFIQRLTNLSSKLQLDSVKYLKGQGAISEGERAILSNSAMNLNRNQSEPEFRKNLQDIVNTLNKYVGITEGGLREQVISKGYDYDTMSQKYSDEEIKQSLKL